MHIWPALIRIEHLISIIGWIFYKICASINFVFMTAIQHFFLVLNPQSCFLGLKLDLLIPLFRKWDCSKLNAKPLIVIDSWQFLLWRLKLVLYDIALLYYRKLIQDILRWSINLVLCHLIYEITSSGLLFKLVLVFLFLSNFAILRQCWNFWQISRYNVLICEGNFADANLFMDLLFINFDRFLLYIICLIVLLTVIWTICLNI